MKFSNTWKKDGFLMRTARMEDAEKPASGRSACCVTLSWTADNRTARQAAPERAV